MICPKCRAKASDTDRFCPSCGAALAADVTLPTPESPAPSRPPSRSGIHGRFPAGTMIAGRYRVVGQLGSGGMGEVYRADDLTLGQSVALKFLPEALAADVKLRDLFVAEARTARELAHPNVCRVYDIGETQGQMFLSMEYVDGEDLSSLLRRIGRLPGEKAVEIARQLCAGLAALHDRGVLHRDLKPSNVMIDGRGRVRITDFGLAAPADAGAGKERVGTPAYMAPEQLDGRGVDARSDIYALGLVLYEIFTGRRAFAAETFAELARLQREGTPTHPSAIIHDLDPAVERVLARCLEKDPAMRPSSAIAVAAALPGGDPLAAALAAGEIPSLEVVAQAGGRGGVRPAVGAACLAAVIAAIALYAGINVRSMVYHWDPPAKRPAVLEDRARELLRSLGYEDPPADHASGFWDDGEVLKHIGRDSKAADRWTRLRSRPGAMRFWYRESPKGMVPIEARTIVLPGDPPRTTVGMLDVGLDGSGRLMALDAVPPRKDAAGDSTAGADWSALFAAAELDFASFREVAPEWVPEGFADARAAWIGAFPGQAEPEIRVEAAAYRGRPVFFRVIGPWTGDPAAAAEGELADRLFVMGILLIILAVLVVGIFLAIRNVRLGRGDQVGARKLSLLIFLLMCVLGELAAHHAGELDDYVNKFFERTSSSLFVGVLVWLFYLALEPYARRAWPEQMVSWSRLITGRWRDPLVGRDILAGGIFFLFNVATGAAALLATAASRAAPVAPQGIHWIVLDGPATTIAWIAGWFVNALFYALFILLFIMLLRTMLRNDIVAMVAYAAIVAAFTYFAAPDDAKLIGAVHGVIVGVAWAFVLFRFGMVTFIVGMYFQMMMSNFPITLDRSVWWSGASYLVIAVILAISAFGLRTALAGERAPGRVAEPRR